MGLLCCFKKRRQQTSSETGPPSKIAIPRRHFLQPLSPHDSKITLGSIKSDQDAIDLRAIFSPPTDINERGRPLSVSPPRLIDASTRTKTNSSLSVLSARIQKRFSKDSNLSKKSSRADKHNVSEEDIERRRELKRALYERVRTEIFQDGRESRAEYDPDAELIATPATVSSLNQCELAVNPVMGDKVIIPVDENLQPTGFSGLRNAQTAREPLRNAFMNDNQDSPTRGGQDEIKVRIVTNASSTSVEFKKVPADDVFHESAIRKRYTVPDLRPRKQRSRGVPLQESTHYEYKPLQESPIEPTYIEIQLSPDLLPLRLPSASTASERDLKLLRPSGTLEQHRVDNVAHESHDVSSVYRISEGEWPRANPSIVDTGGLTSDTGDDPNESHKETGNSCNSVPEETNLGEISSEDTGDSITTNALGALHPIVPTSRRDMSSSTQGSSTTSLLMSRTSLISASGRHRNNHSQRHQGSSQGKAFSQGSFNAVHEEQRPSSIDRSSIYPTHWLPVVRDNGSSVYPSQAGSSLPSPNGSFIRPTSFIDRLKNLRSTQRSSPNETANSSLVDLGRASVTGPDSPEAEQRRRGTVATTSSFQSSTDSFRARELAASELRIVSRPRTDSSARQSRFKEDLGPSVDVPEEHSDHLCVPQSAPLRISVDGTEDFYNSGRRFSYLPGENMVAADSWERALRQTAEQNALVNRRLSSAKLSSRSFQSQLAVHEAKQRLSLLSNADTNFLTVEPRRNRHSYRESVEQLDPLKSEPVSSPDSPAESPHGQSTIPAFDLPQRPTTPPPKRYADSWTRFPSHTRPERCFTPAGEADNVKSYDFALDHPVVRPPPQALLASKAKTKSMHFGKAFKSVGNLYKSTSTNFSRFEHGYRSSISAGGKLKYPELEIPQPWAPSGGSSTGERRLSMDSTKSLDLGQEVDGCKSEESLGERRPRSARVWSKMYEDCVEWPMSSEGESIGKSPVRKDRRGMSQSCD